MLVIHGPRQRPPQRGFSWKKLFSILHYLRFPPVLSHYSQELHLQLHLSSQPPFHCQSPVAPGTIVVVSRSGDPGAEVLVDKLCDLGLDYQMKWDYIST